MTLHSKFFGEAYKACLPQLKDYDPKTGGEILGLGERDGVIILPFFNRELIYDGHDFIDPAGNEVLPAQAGFLFQDNARAYLDLETLSIISTCLTGSLIRPYNEGHETHEPESNDHGSPAPRPGNSGKDHQNFL